MYCRQLITTCLALLGLAVAGSPSAAQDFPSRPIRIVVPFPPGGNVDITARALAPALGEALGVQVVVDNKPGAGGTIGTVQVVKSAPDGYTLLLGSTGTVTVAPTIYKSAGYDPTKDFTIIGPIHSVPLVLTVASKSPASNFGDFVAHAAARNGQLSVGSAGTGSSNHLAIELLVRQGNLKLLHVPYKGSGPALNDLVANQLEAMMDQLPASLPHIQQGAIKVIAVTSAKRVPQLPDTPTLDEVGVKGYEASTFTALLGPAGMPKAVLDKLVAAHRKAMSNAAVRERYTGLGASIIDPDVPAFEAFVKTDYQKWRTIVEDAKIAVD